jgi:hypothetical protein
VPQTINQLCIRPVGVVARVAVAGVIHFKRE